MTQALKHAFKQGQKDFHAGWTEEHNPYMGREFRKFWLKGFKRAKGLEWMRQRRDPDAHLGGVAA